MSEVNGGPIKNALEIKDHQHTVASIESMAMISALLWYYK